MFFASQFFFLLITVATCIKLESANKVTNLINDYEDCLVTVYLPSFTSIQFEFSQAETIILKKLSTPLLIAPPANRFCKSYKGVQKLNSCFCLANFYLGPSQYRDYHENELVLFARYAFTNGYAVSRTIISHVFILNEEKRNINYKILKRISAIYVHEVNFESDRLSRTKLLIHHVNRPIIFCNQHFQSICTFKTRKAYEQEISVLSDNGKTYYYDNCNSSNWRSICMNMKDFPANKLIHPYDQKYLRELLGKGNRIKKVVNYEVVVYLLVLNSINVITEKIFDGKIEHSTITMYNLPHLTPLLLGYNIKLWSSSEFVVVTGETNMNFITCYGVAQPISFTFYFKPYYLKLWITYLLFLLLIVPFFVSLFPTLEANLGIFSAEFLDLFLHICFASYATFFEVSPYFYNKITRIGWNFRAQILLTAWYLMVVVLVNAYKGIVTNHLTLGPETFGSVTKLDQLDNWIIFGSIEFRKRLIFFTQSEKEFSAANIHENKGVKVYYGIEACLCNKRHDLETMETLCKNYELKKVSMTSSPFKKKKKKFGMDLIKKLKWQPKPTLNCTEPKNDMILKKLKKLYNPCKGKTLKHLNRILITGVDPKEVCRTETISVKKYNKTVLNPDWPSINIILIENRNFYNTYPHQSCTKLAFIDYTERINHYEKFSKYFSGYNLPNYRKGHAKIFNVWEVFGSQWIHSKPSNIYEDILWLAQSGILKLWKNACEKLNKPIGFAENKVVDTGQLFAAVAMNGNISTVFFVYIAASGFTIIYFAIAERKRKPY